MDAGRLLVDPAGPGAWNMAVDESLMASAAHSGRVTLRCYRWEPATLSLGYFQSAAERDQHAPSQSCAWVRRHSGGGAILHDFDLTYSLTLPATFRPTLRKASSTRTAEWVYRLVHDVAISVLQSMDMEAVRFADTEDLATAVDAQVTEAQASPSTFQPAATSREVAQDVLGGAPNRPQTAAPFLCFQRRTDDDLVIGPGKVLGSAQRRRSGALLQHGSLLWARSEFAPELPGIAELIGRSDGPRRWQDWSDSFVESFAPQLFEALGMAWQRGRLTEAERDQAMMIRDSKYATDGWKQRR